MNDVLAQLAAILEQRKGGDPGESYVAGLYQGGLDQILKKIGEEAAETIIAAKNDDNEQLVYEMADLWFHSLILLASRDLAPADVLDELARRFGKSGLSEKAERGQKS